MTLLVTPLLSHHRSAHGGSRHALFWPLLALTLLRCLALSYIGPSHRPWSTAELYPHAWRLKDEDGSQEVPGMCHMSAPSPAVGQPLTCGEKLMRGGYREQEHFWISLGDRGQGCPGRGESALGGQTAVVPKNSGGLSPWGYSSPS